MDEITKIAVTTLSVSGILFLVLKIIQAAKGWRNHTNGYSGNEKLLLTQVAANITEISKLVSVQTQTLSQSMLMNERFMLLLTELGAMIKRGIDPEREVTQKFVSDMERRILEAIAKR